MDQEQQVTFSVIGHVDRDPPDKSGLRAMNWRLCFGASELRG